MDELDPSTLEFDYDQPLGSLALKKLFVVERRKSAMLANVDLVSHIVCLVFVTSLSWKLNQHIHQKVYRTCVRICVITF